MDSKKAGVAILESLELSINEMTESERYKLYVQ